MRIWPFNKLASKLTNWLTREVETDEMPASDFERVCYEIHPGDVLLIEGNSRISEVIKLVTRSNWSHAALYVGRLHDIQDEKLRKKILRHYKGDLNEQLLVEGILGKGTIVSPISDYKNDHIRICRPKGISISDTKRVIAYTIDAIGTKYDVRHIFDLFRYLFPITLIPKHLFSSLFTPAKQHDEKQICSSLLAEAFASVNFPILPKIVKDKMGKPHFIHRNPNLFTPSDFDYSPYFKIIKYPLFGVGDKEAYKDLPWNENGVISNDEKGFYVPPGDRPEKKDSEK